MRKHVISAPLLVAAMLVAVDGEAGITQASWKMHNAKDSTLTTTEGDTVVVTFAVEGTCADINHEYFGGAASLLKDHKKTCEDNAAVPERGQLATASVKWSWLAVAGDQTYNFLYNGSGTNVAATYTVSATPKYDPSAHPTTEQFEDHVEDDSVHGGGLDDGTIQVLAQLGGMPNDNYFQRPAFVARILLNATLARARWGGGFKLGVLGGYGETNFNVSPAFASQTEEAPVRIGEWALMAQFTHRPVEWFEWNAGVPIGLRYYSYETQILDLDPSNADALENNNRQFAFWLGLHADVQFIVADYWSVGGFAQFSMNPTKVDVIIGDDMDNGELMPQFTGGFQTGVDF